MFWHYTTGRHIDAIFESGMLKPQTPRWAPGGMPAVWFSTNHLWEPSANCAFERPSTRHRLLGTREMTDVLCDGLFRISVRSSVGVITWGQYCSEGELSDRNVEGCRRVAAIEGSHPGRWLACLREVPAEEWLQVERWYGSQWGVIEGVAEILPSWSESEFQLQAAG
ncbi:hypothetical protein C5Y96_01455 [Blastopirellula marina]|uniref:Uncharacterized protein n=1 Tax=Blastopirellula marina TaxID=124 RepID=A0A2S8G733_9BACT|nr:MULTISPECIES: hypothetical protein [Pirellulaceae]PQO40266.1 hypothetical protein C5Y96_01455 [Blastopirellula marina]RCS55814.1 hypothetical protein DTL36_01455 [Bremerella cremea]